MPLDAVSHWPPILSFVFFLVLGVVLVLALIATAAIVAVQWRKYRQSELLNSLKEEMVCRGMSAEEIARVIEAGRERSPRFGRPRLYLRARRSCC